MADAMGEFCMNSKFVHPCIHAEFSTVGLYNTAHSVRHVLAVECKYSSYQNKQTEKY